MATVSPTFRSSTGTKRLRDDNEDDQVSSEPYGKKVRPTLDPNGDAASWHSDSVITTPTASSSQNYQHPKYDSDDLSSMMSEPGSPQDLAMSSDDDDDGMDTGSFSQSPEDAFYAKPSLPNNSRSPWRERNTQKHRVPTPFGPTRPGVRPMQIKTGARQHIRQRHPQENNSDHLEVPSPIDEDEVPTPPSAAEAAGSQLSMLTVSDMDMEVSEERVPAITVGAERSLMLDGAGDQVHHNPQAPDFEPMDSGPDHVMVRKQRQRSGAQSNGSVSPAPGYAPNDFVGGRRGFSMGFRADCEKCRARVPGHMNHFTT